MSVPAELANRMDWSLTPWTPDTAPNYVSSGTNSLGNEFIKFDDLSYYYINGDGGHYFSDGQPGYANAPGMSQYSTPAKVRYITPAQSVQETGSFFVGIDPDGNRKHYFEDKRGNIVMTLRTSAMRKAHDDSLPEKWIARYMMRCGVEVVVEVDEGGHYIGRNPDLAAELREANWVAAPSEAREESTDEEPQRVDRRDLFRSWREPHPPLDLPSPSPSPRIKEEDEDDDNSGGGVYDTPTSSQSSSQAESEASSSSPSGRVSQASDRRRDANPRTNDARSFFRVSKSGAAQAKGKEFADRLVAKLAHTDRVKLGE